MCPICKGSQKSFIGFPKINSKSQKFIKREYSVVECTECGTYYVYPEINLTIEEWKILYSQQYFPRMSEWYDKNRQKNRIMRLDKLESFIATNPKKFLDVGCGEGYSLIEAMNRGWESFGIDIADSRIESAKDKRIKFFSSDLITCNFSSNFFDIIYLDSVLEHVINPLEYLLEIKRILKKGGILYIGIPNEDSLLNEVKKSIYLLKKSKLSPKLKPFETPYHVVGFNKKSLQYALGKAQFEIKKIRNFACRLEFLRAKTFSKEYFHSLLLLPIYLLAVPIKKEVYFEVYAKKEFN